MPGPTFQASAAMRATWPHMAASATALSRTEAAPGIAWPPLCGGGRGHACPSSARARTHSREEWSPRRWGIDAGAQGCHSSIMRSCCRVAFTTGASVTGPASMRALCGAAPFHARGQASPPNCEVWPAALPGDCAATMSPCCSRSGRQCLHTLAGGYRAGKRGYEQTGVSTAMATVAAAVTPAAAAEFTDAQTVHQRDSSRRSHAQQRSLLLG